MIEAIELSGRIADIKELMGYGDVYLYTSKTGGNKIQGIEGYLKASIFDGEKHRHLDLRSFGIENTYSETRLDSAPIRNLIISRISANAGSIVRYNPESKKFELTKRR